jgi:unsaturated chondroitin disaccharide hydrolase
VPSWDFEAPPGQQEKDSPAAAAVASALLELNTFVADRIVARRYREAALQMLDSLSSPAYLAKGSRSPGILLHGVAFYRNPIKPAGDAIDKSLIYGDYYFVEALMRYKQSQMPPEKLETSARQEARDDGCSAAPGGTLAVAGLMLWLLRSRRRSRADT